MMLQVSGLCFVRQSISDVVNGLDHDAIVCRNLSKNSLIYKNCADLFSGQPGIGIGRSRELWSGALPRSLLSRHVRLIVSRRSQPQMIDIAAWAIVASVAHVQAIWNRAFRQNPSGAMRRPASIGQIDEPIASASSNAHVLHASRLWDWLEIGVQFLREAFDDIGWFSHLTLHTSREWLGPDRGDTRLRPALYGTIWC